MSIDPVTFGMTGDPRFFNRYSYSFNDPINLKDPTGMCPICPLIPFVVGGGGAAAGGTATVGAGTVAVGAGVATFGVLVVTDPLDGVFTNDADEPAGPFEQDDVGKIKNIDDIDIEGLTPEELLEGEQQLEEDKEQRQREQDRNPRGSRNGSREDRENHRQHKKHQDRIKKHDKVRERVKERIDETLPRE